MGDIPLCLAMNPTLICTEPQLAGKTIWSKNYSSVR